jgi:hypothetical protein
VPPPRCGGTVRIQLRAGQYRYIENVEDPGIGIRAFNAPMRSSLGQRTIAPSRTRIAVDARRPTLQLLGSSDPSQPQLLACSSGQV